MQKIILAVLILILSACTSVEPQSGSTAPAPTSAPPKPARSTPTSTPPKPSASATAKPAPLKIMPLGDSITYGEIDPGYGGYRHLLGQLLTADGYSFEFVGSQQSGIGITPDPNNEGHPGWTIPQIKDGIDTMGWLETYQPDLILLHIGTNDIYKGDPASAPDHLSALLADILRRLPRVRIIVAQIINYRSGPDGLHTTFNSTIPGIVAFEGPRVTMVNMQDILSPGDYADDLHPNNSGYDKMARAWEAAIRAGIPPASH